MDIANPHSIEHRTQFELFIRDIGWTNLGDLLNRETAFGVRHRCDFRDLVSCTGDGHRGHHAINLDAASGGSDRSIELPSEFTRRSDSPMRLTLVLSR